MIALRKLFQVFGRGTLSFLNPSNRKILAYLRSLDRGDGSHEIVLCVANLSRFAQPVSLDLSSYAGMEPVEMLGYVPFPTITDTPYQLTLAPYSFIWLELQAAPAESRFVPGFEPQLVGMEDTAGQDSSPLDLAAAGWAGLLAGAELAQLETSLPAWLSRQRWFGAKSRRIQSARILDWIDLSKATVDEKDFDLAGQSNTLAPALFFVEVSYFDGKADTYQLPLAISNGPSADDITSKHPDSIIFAFASASGPAFVHDATIQENFRQALLTLIERNMTLGLSGTLTRDHAGIPSLATVDLNDPTDLVPQNIESSKTVPSELSSPESRQSPLDKSYSADIPVAPLPLDVQPGEAALVHQSDGTSSPPASAQRRQPRESPSAGDPLPTGGRLDARASTAFVDAQIPRRVKSRVGSAEQSNTSILYDDKLILKFFRRIQPGENPDVEIGRFLTEVAHFPAAAPFLGEISITPASGNRATVAMLQGLVANRGDGWEWYLKQLASFYSRVAVLPSPRESSAPSFINRNESRVGELKHARVSLEAAALLGRRTAEMHLALAGHSDRPAFAPEPLTKDDLQRDSRRIEKQLSSTLEALKSRLSTLDEPTSDSAGLLLSKRLALIAQSRSIASTHAGGQRIRIHGDYHLGQILLTNHTRSDDSRSGTQDEPEVEDFVLLDFEGEPARPLEERRRKESPIRDLAGMIRSFSYAAYAGLGQFVSAGRDSSHPVDYERMAGWARLWQNSVAAEFLDFYRQTIGAENALLPPPSQAQALLNAYLLEKALYELLYELDNRPTWLRIPIAGILSL
jgi:maltose alpha-D-glucosyltransferase/alpha-amylase